MALDAAESEDDREIAWGEELPEAEQHGEGEEHADWSLHMWVLLLRWSRMVWAEDEYQSV
jgi:hypothetical protein